MTRGSMINSLRFFEAVARQGSITGAATELGVTPSAVSHHLRQLTEHVGEQLLARQGRGVALTDAGRRLAGRLTAAFAEVENSVRDAVGVETPVVRLAVCSSSGPGFIIPRLSNFAERYPGIELKLILHGQTPDLTDAVGDAFVSTVKEHPGFWSRLLFREMLLPVQAPGEGATWTDPDSPPLITTDIEDDALGDDWRDYWAYTKQSPRMSDRREWLMCSHYLFALEMAKQGLGVALVPDFLAARDLRSGDLVTPSLQRAPSGRSYYLCIKSTRMRERGLSSLRDWLIDGLGPRDGFDGGIGESHLPHH